MKITEQKITEQVTEPNECNDAVTYLQSQNVLLSASQIEMIMDMQLNMEDFANMSMDSDFVELCAALKLTIGPKIKFKSAIIRLKQNNIQKNKEFPMGNNVFEVTTSVQSILFKVYGAGGGGGGGWHKNNCNKDASGGGGAGGWHKNNCNKDASGGGGAGGYSEIYLKNIKKGTIFEVFVGESEYEKDGQDSYIIQDKREIVRAKGGQKGHCYDSNNAYIATGGKGNVYNGENGKIGMSYHQYMNLRPRPAPYLGPIGKGGNISNGGKGGDGSWNGSGRNGEFPSGGGGGGTSIRGSKGGNGQVIAVISYWY